MGDLVMSDTTRGAIASLSRWFDANGETVIREAPAGYDAAKARGMAIQLVRQAEQSNNHLNECTPVSLIGAVLQAARHDLSIDTGEAYVIAYRNKHLGGAYEAQLQIGYKGLARMARRAGADFLRGELVREGDLYNEDNPDPSHPRCGIEHVKGDPFGDAKVRGVYVVIRTGTGATDFESMSFAEIEKARAMGAKGGPWGKWWGEMAKKTVLKRLLKRHELADEDRRLMLAEDTLQAELMPRVSTADLNARFTRQPARLITAIEPTPEPGHPPAMVETLRNLLGECYGSAEEVAGALATICDVVPPTELAPFVLEIGTVEPTKGRREFLAQYGV